MFLNNSSITRPPPSLLPGFDGTRSPVFQRYYEAAKTTGLVLRHSVCHVAPQYLGLISMFARRCGEIAAATPGCCSTGCTLIPVFCPKDTFGSPKFPATPC